MFISKLQITENHRKSGVLENSQDTHDFLENELHESNVMLVKITLMYL